MFRPLFRPFSTVIARSYKNPVDGTVKMWLEPKDGILKERFGDIFRFKPAAIPSDPAPEAAVKGTIIGSFSNTPPTKTPDDVEFSTKLKVNDQKMSAFIKSWLPDFLHLSQKISIVPSKFSENPDNQAIMEQFKEETGLPVHMLKLTDADAAEVDAIAAPIMVKKLGIKKE